MFYTENDQFPQGLSFKNTSKNQWVYMPVTTIDIIIYCAKVYFILYLMKFKYVPLPAQHFLMVNWDTC